MAAAPGRFARISRGARYMAASAFFFSLMSLLVKVAGQRLPAMEVVLARGVVTLALSYAMVRRAGVAPWGHDQRLLLLRGFFGFLALSCFYYALTRLPLAEATVLQYTNPIFTALIAAAWLRERLGPRLLAATLVGFIGVTLITRPAVLFGRAAAEIDPVAAAIALAGATLSGAAYVTVRKAAETEHPLVIVFYFPLVTVPLTIPAVAPVAVWPNAWEWAALLGVGIATQIGQVYLTRGLSLEPAGRAMAIGYLQILFAAMWGATFFAELPDLWALSGSALVIASTFAVGLRRPEIAAGQPEPR